MVIKLLMAIKYCIILYYVNYHMQTFEVCTLRMSQIQHLRDCIFNNYYLSLQISAVFISIPYQACGMVCFNLTWQDPIFTQELLYTFSISTESNNAPV